MASQGEDNKLLQVAELASLAQLLPPCSPTVRNPAPDSSLCRAASPRLRHRIRFHCCSPFASASSCCSPIAPASAAARRLRPLQLLLPIASASAATPRLRPLLARLRPLQLLLARFDCCSPDCIHPPLAGFEHSSRSSRFSK